MTARKENEVKVAPGSGPGYLEGMKKSMTADDIRYSDMVADYWREREEVIQSGRMAFPENMPRYEAAHVALLQDWGRDRVDLAASRYEDTTEH